MSKTDGWILFGVLESFFLLRALGYADEPWWIRWAPSAMFCGVLIVSEDPSDLWSNVALLLGIASLVGHAIWAHNHEPHWSIIDAARRGALIKTAPGRGVTSGQLPG